VSPRTRVWLIVAPLAVAAVAVTLGIVVITRDEPTGEAVAPPPLYLDLGVRNDEQAKTLRRAARLYADGQLPEAARLFARYRSPEARVGAAFASWPRTLDRLRTLPTGLAVVRLNRGIVHAALGDEDEARAEFRAATRVQPDTPYAVKAGDVLHPRFAPGLPAFVPTAPFPKRLDRLSSPEQFAIIEREGKAPNAPVDAVLRYGVALQRLGRPISAQREFDRAVRKRRDAETLTAAALASFDKDRPASAFSRLGPLTRRYPAAQTVRFHLGLALLWIGDVADAKRQLRQAYDGGPQTRLGMEAKRFLDRL
jgi:tetratricopeptide (TPR) repeat protein